jgi:FkbM family methyltransferase
MHKITRSGLEAGNALLTKLASAPLRLIPPMTAVPVLSGALKGRRWIAGSAIHRCWLGFYERDKQRLISREVTPNSIFWDIGANVGFYSLLGSTLVGSGKVFAFEPVPRNLFYLKRHLVINRVTNVEIVELAVSDTNGTATFHLEPTGLMGRLSEGGGVTVQTAALDRLVNEGRILPPNCVKMDIEGAEFVALQGAKETFRNFRPVLFLATHGKEVEQNCRQLLEEWGYECRNMRDDSHDDLGEIVATYRGHIANSPRPR